MIEVRSIQAADTEACAGLLVARHRRDMLRLQHLEPQLAEATGCMAAIESLAANPRADGVLAELAGKPIGFLFGERMLLPPGDFASQFIPPHSISMAVEGHAVAEGADAVAVYRAMYAALAATWVAEGFFTHRASIPAGDPEVQEAWVVLGFGRSLTAATRTVADPIRTERPRTLTIERASPEDIDDVIALSDDLMAWHWESPMFWPNLHATAKAVREFNLAALRSADVPYFVAYEGGRPVGMQSFLRPGFTPPIVKQETDVYLFEGIVANGIRGGGIGGALLKHSIEWAATAGHESCTLHFAPGNSLGAPFWLGHGFEPVEHTMERTIDSRVVWARPRV